jgi:hypothetical protein
VILTEKGVKYIKNNILSKVKPTKPNREKQKEAEIILNDQPEDKTEDTPSRKVEVKQRIEVDLTKPTKSNSNKKVL